MKPLVLIIDDSELILQMIEMVCQQSGYRTITCERFADVPRAVEKEGPQVVVSDLNLPGLGERDVVAALRSVDALREVPIVLVSGMDADELEETAERLGADGAISKEEGMPAVQGKLPDILEDLT
ncbi:MAG: response regulator [Persicimonas sp.]